MTTTGKVAFHLCIHCRRRSEDDDNLSHSDAPVPVDCYFILLARFQGEKPNTKSSFAETREKINQKVQASPENARLLSNLAVVDALLEKKQDAIIEAKRVILSYLLIQLS